MLARVISSSSPSAAVAALTEAALDKEAAAAAATVSSYELHDHVAFSSWLAADLARDLEAAAAAAAARASPLPTEPPAAAAAAAAAAPRPLSLLPGPVAAALARRACLAIAAWVPKITREDRLRCYPSLISALAGGSASRSSGGNACDAAIALAAAGALSSLVDDWDFVEEDFAPLSGAAFAAAARALGGGGSGGAGAASLLLDADSHGEFLSFFFFFLEREKNTDLSFLFRQLHFLFSRLQQSKSSASSA